MNPAPVRVQHFSDILCVWAYAGQIRVDELQATFGDMISLDCHFIDVFGDTAGKISSAWGERGGFAGFAAHVQATARQFDHVRVHPELWTREVPASSLSCHVFLRAVKLVEDDAGPADAFRHAIWAVREAFFRDLVDISRRSAQLEIADALGLDTAAIAAGIDSGRAHAALSGAHALARAQDIRMSPAILLNDGRQQLRGNVGYRVLEANVRELLHNPAVEASWC